MTLKEVSNVTGLSLSDVQNIERRALKKMRAELTRDNSAVNLFHDPKPRGGRKRGPWRVKIVDELGNEYPSMTAAAAARGTSVPNIIYRIRRGQWRYA